MNFRFQERHELILSALQLSDLKERDCIMLIIMMDKESLLIYDLLPLPQYFNKF
jgi:hypothetical protein